MLVSISINMVGFIIGNGLSRLGFDFNRLRGKGPVVGCNRLYQEFKVDAIVAMDNGKVAEIKALTDKDFDFVERLDSKYIEVDGKRLMTLREVLGPYGGDSGQVASAYLVKVLEVDKLYMFGIDFLRTYPGQSSNSTHGGLCEGPGIERGWNLLRSNFPDVEFIRVGPVFDEDKDFYDKLVGFKFITYKKFDRVLKTESF